MSHAVHVRHAVVVADAPHADLHPFVELIATSDLLIAADGGARYLAELGYWPHLVVGDCDSLSSAWLERLAAHGALLERYPVHKNETDLELALLRAVERGAAHVRILAALGGRPDQHLANLQLLAHPALAGVDARLLHDAWEIFAIRDQTLLHGAPGDLVSLLPLSEQVDGIVTEGLFYPLRGETLRLGPARGVSNVLTASRARISVARGVLLCMHAFGAGMVAAWPSLNAPNTI
ncbi:thiamine diphosphokinase [Kallotenue papyrolyticum]|uniref:thiamine diphosphokinase n=1 Tax=Kallotenue papyrolyticum TaxID=1325125 RepID=UPI0009DF3DE2|nr:thiamine diphosphokinase [Kallotenue papyrolyticum]